MRWDIPVSSNDDHLTIELEIGNGLFLVGPNGSGKSALLQRMRRRSYTGPRVWLGAHRQTWFPSSVIGMTPQARKANETQFDNWYHDEQSRWRDQSPDAHLQALLYDLAAAENARNREIAGAIDNGNKDEAERLAKAQHSAVKRLNRLLRLGNLTAQLVESSFEGQIQAQHGNGQPFNIEQLSDGERNAMILAGKVLTVEPNALIMIDEPERHMHRSIMVPLLSALFAEREDCIFVVATHEIELPVDMPDTKTVLVRECHWEGRQAKFWELNILEPGNPLPDDLKRAVLGSRRQILFVEGTKTSLDWPLYTALYPDVSVRPVGGYPDVMRSVNGLRNSDEDHWVKAFGLIDRDDRTADEIAALAEAGIFALPVHSVESLYYHRITRQALAAWKEAELGMEAGTLLATAEEAMLNALRGNENLLRRLATKRCERTLRDALDKKKPTWQQLQTNEGWPLTIQLENPLEEELEKLSTFLENNDIDSIIARYSVRESGMLSAFAGALRYRGGDYERAVITRIDADATLRDRLRDVLQPLTDALSGTEVEAASTSGDAEAA